LARLLGAAGPGGARVRWPSRNERGN